MSGGRLEKQNKEEEKQDYFLDSNGSSSQILVVFNWSDFSRCLFLYSQCTFI